MILMFRITMRDIVQHDLLAMKIITERCTLILLLGSKDSMELSGNYF